MKGLVVLALIALAHTVASAAVGDGEFKVVKCTQGDAAYAECIKEGFKSFLEQSAAKPTQYNFKTYDPLNIKDLKVNIIDNHDIEFKNVKITGFKDQEVTEVEAGNDSNKFQSKVNMVVEAVGVMRGVKDYETPYKLKATVNGGAVFSSHVKTTDGKEFVILGEETINCETVGTPEVTIDENARKLTESDDILKPVIKYLTENQEDARKKIVCAFANEVYKTIGENLRKLLSALPVKE